MFDGDFVACDLREVRDSDRLDADIRAKDVNAIGSIGSTRDSQPHSHLVSGKDSELMAGYLLELEMQRDVLAERRE